MQRTSFEQAPAHSLHPDGPRVSVLFGGDHDSSDVGMVRVSVPAHGRMPSHRHSGSDVVLTPVTGSVRITKGDEVVEVGPGDALLIFKYESVALENPHDQPADLLVAAGPAAFISSIRRWPRVTVQPVPSG